MLVDSAVCLIKRKIRR